MQREKSRYILLLLSCASLALALTLAFCSKSTRSWTILTPEEAENVCVNMVSCEHQTDPDSTATVSSCTGGMMFLGLADSMAYDVGDTYDCVKDAGRDCERLFECINEGRPLQPCDASTYENHCEGDLQVACTDGLVHFFDCSRLDVIYGNATCRIDPDSQQPDCVSATTCSGTSFHCDGNVLEMCMEDEFIRADCSLLGARCDTYMGLMDTCIGTGAGCNSETDQPHCSGTSIVNCLANKEARFDCEAELGSEFTCVQAPDDEPECGFKAVECDPETHVDRCEVNNLVYCRFGAVDSVDCVLLGYTRCESGEMGAYCL
jgi:hypothetical protein